MRFPYVVLLSACVLTVALPLVAQSPNGVINGLVADPSNRVIVGSDVVVVNDVTGVKYTTKTNAEGIYVLPNLPPGPYRLQVSKVGFKTLIKPDIVLNVQDALSINFTLPVGALYETVTVQGGAPLVNAENASVSTVVDRQFVENLPLNGRSFQTLIELTPGVALTPANSNDQGQFSVNGQRPNSNYFMVDGVSANIGMSGLGVGGLGQMGGASLPGLSVLGSTNTLVAVDAMQEFRIQTSTYAPEFGRTPGAQISILTRSGTNQFHGTLFEYFRNDALDANDWFANLNQLPRAAERINDFGGVFGGPIIKAKTFLFISYEGQRLRLPQTGITTVPSVSARQSAPADIQPFLNAFPQPNGADLGNGQAQFNSGYSDRSSLNAASVRVDHTLRDGLTVFGRYSYSPSDLSQRGGTLSLNNLNVNESKSQTLTVGSNWNVKSVLNNEMRFNYSRNRAGGKGVLDDFGGATVPPDSILFPSPYSSGNAGYDLFVIEGQQMDWFLGRVADNVQRQINVIDTVSALKGTHSIRVGVDYLRLSPKFAPSNYFANPLFLDVPSVVSGNSLISFVQANRGGTFSFQDLSVFAQDTWRVASRVTMTYGLRWEFEPPPSTSSGPSFLAVTGFGSPATLAVASSGTPLWRTRYANFAPRVGIAYQLIDSKDYQSVLRGGFGVFYDLATQQVGTAIGGTSYPFGAQKLLFGAPFPLSATDSEPPPISATPPLSRIVAFDPSLKLPYTLQYSVAFEQSLGGEQALSVSYIGSVGRRLLQQGILENPNPNIVQAAIVLNSATSDYNALQFQFHRRLAAGLQALASYTWAHSIDDASSDAGISGNQFSTGIDPAANRSSSDFDIRSSFAVGLTYDLPSPKGNVFARALLGGWATDNLVQGRTAPPVDVVTPFTLLFGIPASVRPDTVPGQPLYVSGTQCAVLNPPLCPGNKGLNPAAFTNPPIDPVTQQPTRQGDLGRNSLRGFGSIQWDFGIHRQFKIRDSVHLQFRAEFFNLINHPNFGSPSNVLGRPFFGESTQMLGRSLGAGGGDGSFSQLYQIGGPRSVQLGLKLQF
jgi:hypothetical protein